MKADKLLGQMPAGDLSFSIKTDLGQGLTTEWRDGERRLEEQVSDMVSTLSIAGPIPPAATASRTSRAASMGSRRLGSVISRSGYFRAWRGR
jgi:hypothetical protein